MFPSAALGEQSQPRCARAKKAPPFLPPLAGAPCKQRARFMSSYGLDFAVLQLPILSSAPSWPSSPIE